MKHFYLRPKACLKTVVHFATCLFFISALLEQNGRLIAQTQTTTHTSPANPNEVKFDIQNLYWSGAWGLTPTPNPPIVAPFYWIFTVYGNGEYSPLIKRTYSNGAHKFCWNNYPHLSMGAFTVPTGLRSSTTNFTYVYPFVNNLTSPITYNPISGIIARKGDPPPPLPMLVLPSSVSMPVLNNIGGRTTSIPAGKSIYLAHSQGYLQDRKGHRNSMFVLSYKPCNASNGKVHLYYGRKTTGTPSSANPPQILPKSNSDHLAYTALPVPAPAYFPLYYNGQPPIGITTYGPLSGPLDLFARHDVYSFSQQYVSGVRGAVGDTVEFRLFDEVDYFMKNNLKADEWSYAMAVLTTESDKCPCPPNKDLLNGVEGFVFDPATGHCTLDSQNVVDIDTIYLKNSEPTDPNRLFISKVCSNGLVYLTLKYYNQPEAPAAASSLVSFNILDPNFEWCQIEGSPVNPASGAKLPCDGCSWLRINEDCNSHSITIKSGLAPGEYVSIRVLLKLKNGSSITNLINYLQTQQILEASIQLLPGPDVLTVKNEVLSKDKESVELTKACIEPFCQQCMNLSTIVISFLSLTAFILAGNTLWRRLNNVRAH